MQTLHSDTAIDSPEWQQAPKQDVEDEDSGPTTGHQDPKVALHEAPPVVGRCYCSHTPAAATIVAAKNWLSDQFSAARRSHDQALAETRTQQANITQIALLTKKTQNTSVIQYTVCRSISALELVNNTINNAVSKQMKLSEIFFEMEMVTVSSTHTNKQSKPSVNRNDSRNSAMSSPRRRHITNVIYSPRLNQTNGSGLTVPCGNLQ